MKKLIPVFSLVKQDQKLEKEILGAFKKVLKRGEFILGNEVAEFEQEFAQYLKVSHAVGVGSGTAALTLALKALGLGRDDEVILPANAYPTAFGVAESGVRLRLIDCGWDGNLDPNALAGAFTKRTRAIVAVHLYGNPSDILGIRKILLKLGRTDIAIIEDCAQAHGATIAGRLTGTFGKVGCFSFYPTKNLGAYGDGGMVVTQSARIAQRVAELRQYGERERYQSKQISGNSRLDELQAVALRVKLRYLPVWNRRRRAIAGFYQRQLGDISGLTLIPSAPGACFHLFVVRTKRRDALQKYLFRQGIGTAVHYPVPIHLQKAFAFLKYKKNAFPKAETLAREVLSLPLFPELTDKEISAVVRAVGSFFRSTL